jgi:aldose sugar dehydrogenase
MQFIRFHTLITVFPFLLSCNSCPIKENQVSAANVSENIFVTTYVKGLEVPWSFEFTPDGRLLIAERPGRIRVAKNGHLKKEPLLVLDDVISAGEAGLMGMTLHPHFADNRLLYICYTRKDDDEIKVRISRLKEEKNNLYVDKIILDNIPGATVHVGCRLKFGPDKKLYITTGDAAKSKLAQQLDSLAGKTLRLNDDGSIPDDNPYVKTTNVRKEIWSFGHRNSQGLDFQPHTGLMFQTEHGPSVFDGPPGGDEVNIVMPKKNYGWPVIHHKMAKKGMISPLLEYTPAVAPAGATFYQNDQIKAWTGNLFFACLRGKSLIRVVLDKDKVIKQERLFKNRFGRIRNVIEGPDGAIYFSTSNLDGRGNPAIDDDRILRMTWIQK